MQRLMLITILLAIFLSVTIVGARALAPPDNSYSPLISMLRRPPPGCPLPCWHNLTLNVTTFEQTQSILSADAAFDQVDIYPNGPIVVGFHDQPDTNRVEITFNGQHKVATIGITGKEPALLILDLFGPPLRLSAYDSCDSKALDLFYPAVKVYLHAADVPRLDSIVDLEVVLIAPDDTPPADWHAGWQGFTARYFLRASLAGC